MGSALETLCGQAFGVGKTYMLGVYMQRSWIILLVSCIILTPIYVFGWGTTGAAVAYDISGWIVSLAQVVYVVKWCTDGWKGLSWPAFKEIWAFVRLSLASAVMLCLEIWYMMVLVVLNGHLGNAVIAVGSISICMNINGWEAMLFIGINAVVSVRVSNELVSGHPRAAKYSVMAVVLESLIIGLFFMFLILISREYFAVIFTSSKELQQAVARLAFLVSLWCLIAYSQLYQVLRLEVDGKLWWLILT